MGRMEKERKHGLRTANNTDRDAFDTMTKLVTWHAYTSLVLLILVQYTISALFSKVCLGSWIIPDPLWNSTHGHGSFLHYTLTSTPYNFLNPPIICAGFFTSSSTLPYTWIAYTPQWVFVTFAWLDQLLTKLPEHTFRKLLTTLGQLLTSLAVQTYYKLWAEELVLLTICRHISNIIIIKNTQHTTRNMQLYYNFASYINTLLFSPGTTVRKSVSFSYWFQKELYSVGTGLWYWMSQHDPQYKSAFCSLGLCITLDL